MDAAHLEHIAGALRQFGQRTGDALQLLLVGNLLLGRAGGADGGLGAFLFLAHQPLLQRATTVMVDRQVAHHAGQVRRLRADGAGKARYVELQVGIVHDVFGMATASGDPGGEADQAVALVEEHIKQWGTTPGCSELLHEAPDL
ncbi:hypothetical protein D3C78_1306210 [compost metagenome]